MKTFKHIWTHMDSEEKQVLADKCHTSKSALSQIAHRKRHAGRKMIRNLIGADPRLHSEMFL